MNKSKISESDQGNAIGGGVPARIKLAKVPAGISEITAYYGDPEDPETGELDGDFLTERTTVVDLPFPLRLSWRPEKRLERIRVHNKVAESMVDALEEILGVVGAEALDREKWNYLGGVFHYRKMVAYNALSTHSWGIAIDLNPHRAGWGKSPATQLGAIVRAFKARGWEWGGDWPPQWTSDPMHFQAATGY